MYMIGRIKEQLCAVDAQFSQQDLSGVILYVSQILFISTEDGDQTKEGIRNERERTDKHAETE